MPRRKKDVQSRAVEAAESARPYVKRLIEDEDLRENLREAYDAARDAYERASEGKGPAKSVLEDKKLQGDLRNAAESLRAASDALREPEREDKGGHLGKLLLVAFVAAVLALVLSEGLRKAALDKLFGAEEEFEYTSTTTPPPPPGSAG